jgi:hypothetical protein
MLLYLLTSHVAIVGTWAVLASAMIGVGLLYRRLFSREAPDPPEVLTAFWAGLALVLLLLQSWHLALPITATALFVVVALGATGLVAERGVLRRVTSRRPWSGHRRAVLLTLGMIVWAANRSTGPIEMYDTGMYHIPVVEWAKAYPSVPGLANLHGRLAFNSASLLFAAMIDHGAWSGRSFHVANGLLLVVFGTQASVACARAFSGRSPLRPADLFDVALLVLTVGLLAAGKISSLETDLPVALMLLVAGSRIHRSLTEPEQTGADARWHFAIVVLLLGAAVCVKLSAVALAGALFIAAVWAYWPWLRAARIAAVGAALVPASMGMVWAARGVVLSGFPVYPSTVLAAPVPWRVPTEQAVAEAAWIRLQELDHDRIVAGYDWLVPWAVELATDFRFVVLVLLPAAITVVLGLLSARAWRRRPSSAQLGRGPWALLPAVVVGTSFWFVAAPRARFGTAPLWLGAALMTTLWFSVLCGDEQRRRRQVGRLLGVVGAAGVVAFVTLAVFRPEDPARRRRLGATSSGGLFFLPGPDFGLYPVPAPVLVSYVTASGLRLAVPKHTNQCWRGPLLCTPHPAPNLRLRNPRKVADGFVAEGNVWMPVRWPNPWTPFLPWLACRRANGGALTGAARDSACIAQTAHMPTDTLDRVTTPYR